MSNRHPTGSCLYDDLLAWLCPWRSAADCAGAAVPGVIRAMQALALELTLPTWLAGA
jgi:hypothetical protein